MHDVQRDVVHNVPQTTNTSSTVNFAAARPTYETKHDGVHVWREHKSSHVGIGEKHAADGAGSRSSMHEPDGANAMQNGKNDAMDDIVSYTQHHPCTTQTEKQADSMSPRLYNFPLVPFPARKENNTNTDDDEKQDTSMAPQRIPTPPHAIKVSPFSTPSYTDKTTTAPVPAIAVARAALFPSSPPSPHVLGNDLILDVDLRSPGCHYAMSLTPANKYAMLQKIIHKMATVSGKSYSPANMMVGMQKQNIRAEAFSKAKMADKYAKKQAAAAAGAALSSLPPPARRRSRPLSSLLSLLRHSQQHPFCRPLPRQHRIMPHDPTTKNCTR